MSEPTIYINHVYRDWWEIAEKMDADGCPARVRKEATQIANQGVTLGRHGTGYKVDWQDGVLERLQNLVGLTRR